MNEETTKPYFDGIKAGDRVWSMADGEIEVTATDNNLLYQIIGIRADGAIRTCTMDGVERRHDLYQTWFWSCPSYPHVGRTGAVLPPKA